ncbi:hypothetical protein PLCT2_00415 [Planctomycetaceae bacterium]|nr:hypothetical protein PLCT2_00415 [Planctomycetaceae bacterium]
MKWLIDASLPRSVADVLNEGGHECVDVRDIGLATASDEVLATHAKAHGLVIITGDFDFADIRMYPPREYAGIVVLQVPERASLDFVLNMIRNLLKQAEILDLLPGKLAIVDAARIRVRTE